MFTDFVKDWLPDTGFMAAGSFAALAGAYGNAHLLIPGALLVVFSVSLREAGKWMSEDNAAQKEDSQ